MNDYPPMYDPTVSASITSDFRIIDDAPLISQINQPVPMCFTFPLLHWEFCHWLRDLAEQRGKWKVHKGDPYGKHEQYLMWWPRLYLEIKKHLVFGVLKAIIDGLTTFEITKIRHAFLIKYDAATMPPAALSMGTHYDDKSLISITINLDDDFKGGGIKFLGSDQIITGKTGHAVMFPGSPFMMHEALKVTDGVRYAMVLWLS